MILTHKEAREKQCRLIPGFMMQVNTLSGPGTGISCANCVGSECMCWRWTGTKKQVSSVDANGTITMAEEPQGYCGLVPHLPLEVYK